MSNKKQTYEEIVEAISSQLLSTFGESARTKIAKLIEELKIDQPLTKPIKDQLLEALATSKAFAQDMLPYLNSETKRIYLQFLSTSFDGVDKQMVRELARSCSIFLGAAEPNSQLVSDIGRTMGICVRGRLTRTQTARVLQSTYGSLTPSELAEKYGSSRYWEGFVRSHATRTKSFCVIRQLHEAGFSKYRIVARLSERTCPICRRLHGTVLEVADAMKRIKKYNNATQIQELKKAMPWHYQEAGPKENILPGTLPSFHFHCQCNVRLFRFLPGVTNWATQAVNIAARGKKYWLVDRGQTGEKHNRERHTIDFSFLDNTNKEWLVTKERIKHFQARNHFHSSLISAVRDPAFICRRHSTRDFVFLGRNGYIVVMRDNVVWTTYQVGNAKNIKKNIRKKLQKEGDIYVY